METVTRKALGSGLRWGKLGTEDSPVSDWGGGEEDEPKLGILRSDSATDCSLCYCGFQQSPFPHKNS